MSRAATWGQQNEKILMIARVVSFVSKCTSCKQSEFQDKVILISRTNHLWKTIDNEI